MPTTCWIVSGGAVCLTQAKIDGFDRVNNRSAGNRLLTPLAPRLWRTLYMPDFDLEHLHWHAGRPLVAGVDEAGRGCLAGPVVAAAVILPPEAHLPGLDDSKKLSADERQRLFGVVHDQALAVGVGACSPQEVDTLNVLWAAMEAMHRALTDLALVPDAALIDGNRVPPEAAGATASGVLEAVVKGDARSLSIAAASVIAKVTRDRLDGRTRWRTSRLRIRLPQRVPDGATLRCPG